MTISLSDTLLNLKAKKYNMTQLISKQSCNSTNSIQQSIKGILLVYLVSSVVDPHANTDPYPNTDPDPHR